MMAPKQKNEIYWIIISVMMVVRQPSYCGCKPCHADHDLWLEPMLRAGDGENILLLYPLLFRWLFVPLSWYWYCLTCLTVVKWILSIEDWLFLWRFISWSQALNVESGEWHLGLGSDPAQYIETSERNCEKKLSENLGKCYKMTKRIHILFAMDYVPELDMCHELEPEQTWLFQSLIGIMRWMVGSKHIDIMIEVLFLLSQPCPEKDSWRWLSM